MIFFVMSAENTINTMSKMQETNLQHSYFCEDMFSHFKMLYATEEEKREVIKDFLSVSDGIIVVGEITDEMNYALDFAEIIGLEVEYVENPE